jgi:hypothetical protein
MASRRSRDFKRSHSRRHRLSRGGATLVIIGPEHTGLTSNATALVARNAAMMTLLNMFSPWLADFSSARARFNERNQPPVRTSRKTGDASPFTG